MFQFLTIANLNASKGVLVLLDSCRLLREPKTQEDFRCHLVGAATAELSAERIRKEIVDCGLETCVIYHGRRFGEDKEALFTKANAFLLPTFDDCFPLVILEAMQHALPVISTPVGAIPDMVDEGVTGLLVPTGDAGALARAMRRLMDAPEAARTMGRAGLARFLERHTTQQFEHNLLRILQDALPSPRRQ